MEIKGLTIEEIKERCLYLGVDFNRLPDRIIKSLMEPLPLEPPPIKIDHDQTFFYFSAFPGFYCDIKLYNI